MKRKLLLLTALVVSALTGMRAQTDVTSTYITNADFESTTFSQKYTNSSGSNTRYVYEPEGVCSSEMIFDIEDDIVKSLKVINGCDGNLKGISSLVVGMHIDEVISKLKGIECGFKNTSCPDQIAKALEQYKSSK